MRQSSPSSGQRIDILLVGSQQLALEGLSEVLRGERDLPIISRAEGCTAALTVMDSLRPDVVLVDVDLPDCTDYQLVVLSKSS